MSPWNEVWGGCQKVKFKRITCVRAASSGVGSPPLCEVLCFGYIFVDFLRRSFNSRLMVNTVTHVCDSFRMASFTLATSGPAPAPS